MGIAEILAGEMLSGKTVKALSETSGADTKQIKQLISTAMPILISGMQQNAKTKSGAKALAQALEQHAYDDVSDIAKAVASSDTVDGKKILSHVLGDKNTDITKGLSKSTGLTSKQVTTILSALAPILLSLLSTQKNEEKTEDTDLAGMLGSLLFGKESDSSKKDSGIDLGDIATALLGGSSSGKSENTTAELAGSLLTSLLSNSSKEEKKDSNDTMDALGSILGSILK